MSPSLCHTSGGRNRNLPVPDWLVAEDLHVWRAGRKPKGVAGAHDTFPDGGHGRAFHAFQGPPGARSPSPWAPGFFTQVPAEHSLTRSTPSQEPRGWGTCDKAGNVATACPWHLIAFRDAMKTAHADGSARPTHLNAFGNALTTVPEKGGVRRRRSGVIFEARRRLMVGDARPSRLGARELAQGLRPCSVDERL